MRALALAEAGAGRMDQAAARLDALIEAQREAGVAGLRVIASYQARARVAIAVRDADAVVHLAGLTVREQSTGSGAAGSSMAAELVAEARDAGLAIAFEPGTCEASVLATEVTSDSRADGVAHALDACEDAKERAQHALGLLCGLGGTREGFLFLVGADGELALAASRPDANASPTPELVAFARGFFSAQICDDGLTAGLTQATHMLSVPGAACYFDEDGGEHRVLMLSCRHDGALHYVGLAVLDARQQQRLDPATVLYSTALASALLRAGDTQGRRVDDDRDPAPAHAAWTIDDAADEAR